MSLFRAELGIDLGSVNILVYERGRGIVIQEPSVVTLLPNADSVTVVDYGEAARQMVGRTPDALEVTRPIRDGVIADYEITQMLLRYFVNKVKGPWRFLPPRIVIGVPYGVTSVERRAVKEAAFECGASEVFLLREPLAAAMGAGLPVDTATGNLILDVGGGTAEAAVISMNGIVAANATRVGGIKLDEAIMAYIRRKYNIAIGEPTAEDIKIRIGSATPLDHELTMQVQGRDQVSGLPRMIEINSGEITEALQEPLLNISACVRTVLERTPPELASDIIDRGMAMTGGTALLRNMGEFMTRQVGVPAYLADAPMACVALGCGRALEDIEALKRTEFAQA